MATKVRYGILGGNEVEVDDNGFIEIPVIVQESGMYVGIAPAELRSHTVASYGNPAFNRRYVAKLNQHTDLPFYLTVAKIKILGDGEKITDDMIVAEGLEPLPDR